MTKYTTIKAGYRLTVTSWENDADNYNTNMIEGLSKEDVAFHVKLAKLFYSQSRNKNNFGNMYEPSESERARLAAAIAELVQANDLSNTCFSDLAEMVKDVVVEDGDIENDDYPEFMDYVHDVLWEMGLTGGDFYTRVLDKYKVEHVPHDIQIQDVTHEFQ